MTKERSVAVELRELNLAGPGEEEFFVRERPIETLARRFEELQLSPERIAEAIGVGLTVEAKLIEDVLAEEIHCPDDLLSGLLHLAGYEAVAIPDLIQWRSSEGHYYYFERCVYCRSNIYDVDLYGPEVCPSAPASSSKTVG